MVARQLAGTLEAARDRLADAQAALAGLGASTGGGMLDARMAEILLHLGPRRRPRAGALGARAP